jgi:hypothetical protein
VAMRLKPALPYHLISEDNMRTARPQLQYISQPPLTLMVAPVT